MMKSGAIALRHFSFPPKKYEKAIWKFRHEHLSLYRFFLSVKFSLRKEILIDCHSNLFSPFFPFSLCIFIYFLFQHPRLFSHAFRLSIVSCLAPSDGLLFHGRGLFSRGNRVNSHRECNFSRHKFGDIIRCFSLLMRYICKRKKRILYVLILFFFFF